MRNYIKPVTATVALTFTLHVSHALAQNSGNFGTGLKPLTTEENQKLFKKKIKTVRPNKLGLQRINQERQRRGQPPLTEDPALPEMDTEDTLGATNSTSSITTTALGSAPAQVDNSTLASFPPIGNQGALGSCVAFASTYYQMSHEVCLTLGCNNKTAGGKIFSPKWTYNLINGGADNGSYFSDAFSVLSKHGAALYSEFPYDSNYVAWSLTPSLWKNAITYKMNPVSYTAINTDAGMATVKQMLANGHIVIIGTYINSWVWNTVKANPSATSNPFAGQSIVQYLNGTSGGHAMTIVGYDDTVWTDLNGNGLVESQELGAFKIANSYGTGWRNGGYAWAAYDAFRATSTVPGFAPAGRVQLTQSGNVSVTTYTPYTPKVLAEVSVSHALRNQTSLQFGSSSNTASSPSTTWTPFAFVNVGGGYAFDGSTTEKQGTFYFDLTSLAAADPTTQKFYLTVKDSTAGSALTAYTFNVVDATVGNTLMSAAGVPVAVDATSKILSAGNTFIDTTAPTVPGYLKGSLSKTRGGKSAKVVLSWSASTDNVAVKKYIIYRNNVKIGESTSLGYSDSSISKGVNYSYQVSAVDGAGNESGKSSAISVLW